ncbi:hypothetical protein KP509_04G074400 [Ceratopteris richardii]|uniref:TIR domain-containing protein n=1 Tax=Ceratopteris richardii TaxID=49495 RepID=A0A8T2UYF7_CERRI|nr:hypothetical protein KP509_04G074400 [Ceratopteris richardii]
MDNDANLDDPCLPQKTHLGSDSATLPTLRFSASRSPTIRSDTVLHDREVHPAATDVATSSRAASSLSVRFARVADLLELPHSPHPTQLPEKSASHGSSSSISSSSVRPNIYTSTTATYNSSGSGSSSTPPVPFLSSGIPVTPEPASPPGSAFVSASASPFSPPLVSKEPIPEVDLGQAALPLDISSGEHQSPHKSFLPPPSSPEIRSTLSRIDDKFLELRFSKEDCFARSHSVKEKLQFSTPSDVNLRSKSTRTAHFEGAPPTPIINGSPSTSLRPRTCDVYIGIHGYTPSLSRFSKWLRAELEFQGIACFLADRARYSDSRIHDVARRIIQSCTFGVVVISKKTFRNLYSVEELQIFLERKNLVPLFFELAPADCMARDMIERRGDIWEDEGGDLWRAYGGKEREWRDAVDGLSRVDEWKLDAFNGNWRDCILRAVSLLGTRIGRRSVAERERIRKQRVEREEFPFPRNPHFVGREKKLRTVERYLFGDGDTDAQPELDADTRFDQRDSRPTKLNSRLNGRLMTSQSDRWWRREDRRGKDTAIEEFERRRKSDADTIHSQYITQERAMEAGSIDVRRRKSESDRWLSYVRRGFDEVGVLKIENSEGLASMSYPGIVEGYGSSEMGLQISKSAKIKEVSNDHFVDSMARQKLRYSKQRNSSSSFMTSRRKTEGCRSKSESVRSFGEQEEQKVRTNSAASSSHGISVYVCGEAGMGKTELALEFAYRYSQRYRSVLWIGGEARYLRQNYLNLSVLLGLDVGTESQVGPERGRVRTFEEQEREALHRVRRELERDVPYLLIIDNLESERDWWDRKDVSELMPRLGSGSATHVIITTRLAKMAAMPNAITLLYLSSVEALALLHGKRQLSVQEMDALREMEERLDRSIFGLALVGKLLAEIPGMMPTILLEKVNKSIPESWTSIPREHYLKNNTFLLKLLSVCFSYLEQLGGPRKLAIRMACIGGWCAPFPVPVSLLGAAAIDLPEHSSSLVARVFRDSVLFCGTTQTRRAESEAGLLLVRLGIARSCTKQGWIFFDEIFQLYARKRGGLSAARAMVQGIKRRGLIAQHSEHFWAASFLVFGFANDPVVVDLRAVELLSFIKKGALQLAFRAFTTFSRCRAALELLRLCTNMLEDVEKSFVSQSHDWWGRSLCWRASSTQNYMVQQAVNGMRGRSSADDNQVDEYVWEEATLLKALLLETRAKLLLKGGQFDAGEEICRTCISIRTVMLGENHPDTLSAQGTLAKLVRARSEI